MDNKELVYSIIDLYSRAREISSLPIDYAPSKLMRGRSHTISSMTEDLFAGFLLNRFPDVDKIVIDQPISYKEPQERAKTLYPDLSIIKGDAINYLVDIKMDLGWKREDIVNMFENAVKAVASLRDKEVCYKHGNTKYQIKMSPQLKYFIVVVSRLNIAPRLLEAALQKLQADKFSEAQLYFLTGGAHPNWPDSISTKSQIEILPDFDILLQELKERA